MVIKKDSKDLKGTKEEEIKKLLSEMSDTENEGLEDNKKNITSSIELTYAAIEHLFDINNISMITDLSSKEIQGINKLLIIDQIIFKKYKTDSIIRTFINNLLVLKISKNRLGRHEILNAVKNQGYEEDTIKTGFKRFL